MYTIVYGFFLNFLHGAFILLYNELMKRKNSKISIFQHQDYRSFLRDWAREAKSLRSFSFRAFSQRAGFSSPNFFKLVMDGERNLSSESVEKFILGLKLNKQEATYFRALVNFTQAKDHESKNAAYQKMLGSRKLREIQPINKSHYEFYQTWYHPIVRELAAADHGDGSAAWIAGNIFPAVSIDDVSKSLALLEKLGFLKKDDAGHWKQSSPVLSTGPEVESHLLFLYHLNVLELGKHALKHIAPQRRDFGSLTLSIAKHRLPELKQKIQDFRQEILALVAQDKESELFVQLNTQLFPLTRDEEKGL